MNEGNEFVSPIAIDLGAQNTGVYFAHYPKGSELSILKNEDTKEGKVYVLEKNSYTLLMANRTAKRHQRRCYDRRKMAKRLFRLIWEKHFGFPWDKDVQQTISFLLNRRGFSFLTEEYDPEILSQFPKEAFEKLPEELKQEVIQNDNSTYDFTSAIRHWIAKEQVKEKYEAINKKPKEIKEKYEAINKKPKEIKEKYETINKKPKEIKEINRELYLITCTEKLKNYCLLRKEGKEITDGKTKKKDTTFKASRWLLGEWQQRLKIQGLPDDNNNEINIVKFLNETTPEQVKKIYDTIHLYSPSPHIKKKELKNSEWYFNAEKFNQEENFVTVDGEPDEKTHIHHLAFALYKTNEELTSGNRHRTKYFKEVREILIKTDHSHNYLKKICTKLQSGDFRELTVDSLTKLIGHISNLELKPLRKYFNNEKHKTKDIWDEKILNEIFENWILNEWRVGEKDKDKSDNSSFSYKELRELWSKKANSVVNFWLNTEPEYTTPPYQDNNNRRPPRCQSLILNVEFLDSKYPNWKKWLDKLKGLKSVQKYLDDYADNLRELKSGKGNSYFYKSKAGNLLVNSGRRNMEELESRIMQFIFDRVKDKDPLSLNEIYSYAKKIRQNIHKTNDKGINNSIVETKNNLEKSIENSALPDDMKINPNYDRDDLFPKDSFLHLICKYYKNRQRAREGRIFIHPEYRSVKDRGYENTKRFDNKNNLLTYCNHKPRQKRYQIFEDLASVLRISPLDLKRVVNKKQGKDESDKLFKWLNSIDSLEKNCDRASEEQKERKGRLKSDIQGIFGLIYHRKKNENPSKKEIGNILKNSKVKDPQKLYNFCKRAKERCLNLTTFGLYDESRQQQWEDDLNKNPATAVYFLSQINNIVKERSGNAKTCAVCSMDNAQRMQIADTMVHIAKAQRLPAIPTRIIDGAVMRMARIVGGAIADDKWERIGRELKSDKRVCVPIIIESNQFEFEPSREELVKSQRIQKRRGKVPDPNQRDQRDQIFKSKEERIKESSKEICPYTGEKISSHHGEIDHIIPRTSEWGILNDESNLIYASKEGNRQKSNKMYSLKDLKSQYKEKIFRTKNDDIEQWIINQIWDKESNKFIFGKYRNFSNLTIDQQIAFRHALFLNEEHPLRGKVINAINNINRTLVNGTQRYFSEVLANNLYKKAKRIRKEHLLSFDYYEVDAYSNSGNNIYDLRRNYVEGEHEVISKYKKGKEVQKPYSHLIDAQLSFALAASDHRNRGGLGIEISDEINMWFFDKDTGEVLKNLFDTIHVSDEGFKPEELNRKKPNESFCSHRAFTRDMFYADRYLPVLLKLESGKVQVKIGFDWSNSVKLGIDTPKGAEKYLLDIIDLLPVCNRTELLEDKEYSSLEKLFSEIEQISYFNKQRQEKGYCCITVNRSKLHDHWREKYNSKTGDSFEEKKFVYKYLHYKTEKVKLDKPEDLSKKLCDIKKFEVEVERKPITLPVKKQWQDCWDAWEREKDLFKDKDFKEFLKNYFKPPHTLSHQKVRKVFSLPTLSKEGKILMRRKSWTGNYTYQIVNDSDSRKDDNKPNVPIRKQNGERGKKLAEWAKSENIIKFKDGYEDGKPINPTQWYKVDKKSSKLPDEIEDLWYRIKDSTAPLIAIKLAQDGENISNAEFMENPMCKHGFRKNDKLKKSKKDVRNEFFEKEIKTKKRGAIIPYEGSKYNKEMQKAFKEASLVGKLPLP